MAKRCEQPGVGYRQAIWPYGTLTGNTPQVGIDGVNGFGLGFEGALMADQATPVNLDLSWVKGSHSMKFGVAVHRISIHLAGLQALSHATGGSGSFAFSRRETGLPSVAAETGVGYASFLLGEVDNSTRHHTLGWTQLLLLRAGSSSRIPGASTASSPSRTDSVGNTTAP